MPKLLVPRSDLSAAELLATAKPEDQAAVLAAMSEIERAALFSWEALRRPTQRTPLDDDWFAWFYMGGRGSGKTRTAAEETLDRVEALHKATRELARWAVVAPTFGDFRDIDVEGESGLLAALNRRGIEHEWNRSHGELKTERWLIQGYSAEKPDRLRGPQFHGAWLDEPGSFRFPKYLWDNLLPALRLGRSPKLIVTGTPRITWLIKHLVEQAKKDPKRYRLARSTTWRNAANLPAMIVEILEASYGGTRLGRQELGGELLEEAEGALWNLDILDATRLEIRPGEYGLDAAAERLNLRQIADGLNLHKRCVAIDPGGSVGPDSDETGIVGGGCTAERFPHAYILGDRSGVFAPEVWARRAIDFAIEIGASRIVAEKNYGGDLVKANIKAALRPDDPYIHIDTVHAKVGKELRAGPVATYYQGRRVHHVGTFGELETQCFRAGTMVTTSMGQWPIESVRVGDLVQTREGWRPVTRAGQSGVRSVVTLTADDGWELTCTPDHLLWIAGEGWVRADQTQSGRLLGCHDLGPGPQSSLRGAFTHSTTATAITDMGDLGSGARPGSSIAICGSPSTDPSLRAGTSTTEILIDPITRSITSRRSQRGTIIDSTAQQAATSGTERSDLRSARPNGADGSPMTSFASRAGPRSSQRASGPCSAPDRVVGTITRPSEGTEPVYDLTVEGCHEFFANGVLVHNCVTWVPGSEEPGQDSPDRVDALVYLVLDLLGGPVVGGGMSIMTGTINRA